MMEVELFLGILLFGVDLSRILAGPDLVVLLAEEDLVFKVEGEAEVGELLLCAEGYWKVAVLKNYY
jgi:hypothetical protein